MPGVLSSIFQPADDAGESSHYSSTDTTADAGGDFAVDEQVGLNAGVTYQDADGGTHSMQFDNAVGVNADAGAAIGAALGTEQGTTDLEG